MTAAKIRLQIDVGFGDVITPEATEVLLPSLLDFPAPWLRAYPRETVIAEKLEAVVQFGLANSRLKDFYDLLVLSRAFAFDGDLIVRAVRATFERRKTPLPTEIPIGLTAAFGTDAMKTAQWNAFLRKSDARDVLDLADVVAEIAGFAGPVLLAAVGDGAFAAWWPPRGPWRS